MNNLRVASININGIRSFERRRLLLQFCLDGKLDIVGLQEVTFHECSVLGTHYNILSNIGPKRLGTAVLIRKGIHFTRELLEPDGRLISIDVGEFTFINIYAPSGTIAIQERNSFLRKTLPAYAITTNLPLVIVGDFNCIDDALDRSVSKTSPSRTKSLALIELISGLELVDMWKKLRPRDLGHSFHHSKGSCRIDRIYTSRTHSEHIANIELRHLSISDHHSLECTILLSGTVTRSRFNKTNMWKLNTSVLSEEVFQNRIKSFIDRSIHHPLRETDCAIWWEKIFKPGVKRVAISYCKDRANLIRNTKLFYQTCIQEIVNTEPLDWIAFKELRSSSKSWEESLLQGFGVRSRSFEGSDAEDATVFHVKKTRENFRNSTIDTLISPSGEEISHKDEVNRTIVEHFSKIFKDRPPPDSTFETAFLDGIKNRCKNLDSLLTPITPIEIKTALLATKRNKSPGMDGIPIEFYICFWDLIAPHFLDMFLHVLERDSISQSQGRAAIRLVPKSNGPCGVSGFRPISLLNTDYKLMASVLSNRLKRSLHDTIGNYQKGGVPGRLLTDNLCLYRDVIQYVDDRSKPEQHTFSPGGMKAGIIGVDLEKAYDLVNREVLWKIMEVMGYPIPFIKWLRTMYSVTQMSILNGTEVAGTISDFHSVRQGCPLSMHLFVIYIEPLLTRLSTALNGINLFGTKVTVRAMVDDVAIFVSSDSDIINAGEVLDQFCNWTKARMNKQKTKALGLGSWRSRSRWPLAWLESVPTLSLLGIKFSPSIQETMSRLWDTAYGHLIGQLRENASRQFTIYQKVNYLKAKVLSRTIYIAQILPCPAKLCPKILSAIVRFIWLGKIEKPQRCVVFRKIPEGGLSLTEPSLFYKALFLRPLFNALTEPESPESSLLRYWMAFSLRKHLPNIYKGNSIPVAVIERPFYLEEPVHQIKQLLEEGIISPNSRMVHRNIYATWISKVTGPGKTELLYPHLDWKSIWRNTAALKNTKIKETMFLFNQRLLPTRARDHRIDSTTDPTCCFCNQETESDEHVMLHCPSREISTLWLERTLRTQGCSTIPMDFIRGQLGPVRNPRTSFALVAAYIYATWKERRERRTPSTTEIESLWASIL